MMALELLCDDERPCGRQSNFGYIWGRQVVEICFLIVVMVNIAS